MAFIELRGTLASGYKEFFQPQAQRGSQHWLVFGRFLSDESVSECVARSGAGCCSQAQALAGAGVNRWFS